MAGCLCSDGLRWVLFLIQAVGGVFSPINTEAAKPVQTSARRRKRRMERPVAVEDLKVFKRLPTEK